MPTELQSRIVDVMASVLGVDASQIDEKTSTDTMEKWDSLKHMNLVVALEEEFDIEFDDDEIMDMVDFSTIEKLVTVKSS